MNVISFTREAQALVARNDRRAHRRAFLGALRHAATRVGLAWSALALAAFVLVLLPLNMRMA